MTTHKNTAPTEEEALATFYATMLKYNHQKEEFNILGVRKDGRGTWTINYEHAKPAVDLPNAKDCDACRAWNPDKGCSEGNRPGTCGHSVKVKTKPIPTSVYTEVDTKVDTKVTGSAEIETSKIVVTGFNPRKHFDDEALQQLADSIKSIGMLEPILVRPKGSKYELAVGERRLRAAKLIKLERVPAIVRDMTDDEILDAMIAENVCREDLNPIEEANHLKRTWELGKKKGLTQEDLARKYGKTQSWLAHRLILVDAPSALQEEIMRRRIKPSSAVDLLEQRDKDGYQQTLDDVLARAKDGEVTQEQVREIIRQRTGRIPVPDFIPDELKAFARDLRVPPEAVEVLKAFAPFPVYVEILRKIEKRTRFMPDEVPTADIVQGLADGAVQGDYDGDRSLNLSMAGFDVKECRDCPSAGKLTYPEEAEGEREYCINRDCFVEKRAKAKVDSEAELVEKERLTQIGSRPESYENSYEKPEPASAMPPMGAVLPTELPTELPLEVKVQKCHVLSCGEQTEPGGHWCSEHLTPESRKPKEEAEEGADPDERRIVTRAQYALQGRRLFLDPGDEKPPKFEELPEAV